MERAARATTRPGGVRNHTRDSHLARAALGRSAVIPNQGLLINTISLQDAKASSAIEDIFTTDDDLYRSFSELAFALAAGP